MDEQREREEKALEAVRKVAAQIEAQEVPADQFIEAVETVAQAEETIEESVMEDLRNLMIPKTTTEISVNVINQTYERLYNTAFNAWDAHTVVIDATTDLQLVQAQLKKLEMQAVLDGSNTGKNEDQRKAYNQATFADQYAQIAQLQSELLQAQNDESIEQLGYDIAKWDVQRVERILHFFEIQVTINMAQAEANAVKQPQGIVPSGSVLKVKH